MRSKTKSGFFFVGAPLLAGCAGLAYLFFPKISHKISTRIPVEHTAARAGLPEPEVRPLNGKLNFIDSLAAPGVGEWPGFRGQTRSGISPEKILLEKINGKKGPRALWRKNIGEGYAGAAIAGGRVFVVDYDQEKKADAIRCFRLDNGQPLWSYLYPIKIKRNHGMSRTVPAVSNGLVVALGPKCHVTCFDAKTGQILWAVDLVKDLGATVPPWYAGQCPLVDNGRVILGTGGKNLAVALSLDSGKVLWTAPNPRK